MAAKKFILKKHFKGLPKRTDFKLVEEDLPELKHGEFLSEAVYLSVDPYMRAYAHRLAIGDTMVGTQIAKITATKHEDFPIGTYVFGKFDWRTHTISNGNTANHLKPVPTYLLPDFGQWPISYGLGILGMPGLTAHLAFLEKGFPKSGETIVVSGAAGAVGSIVGQIGKIVGCKVIGIAGSETKGEYLVGQLGFDGFVNYKSRKMEEELVKKAPNGIDCYFDNVAGETSSIVIRHMNTFGRIVACGSISSYNEDPAIPPKVSSIQLDMLRKQLKMSGFQAFTHYHRMEEVITKHLNWLDENQLKYAETVTEGFENTPTAFINMLCGKNVGKAIVKL